MTPLTVLPFALINAFRASWMPWSFEEMSGSSHIPILRNKPMPMLHFVSKQWLLEACFALGSAPFCYIRFCVPWRLYPENFVGGRNVHPRQRTSTPRLKDVRVPSIWTYESWINIANFESKSDRSFLIVWNWFSNSIYAALTLLTYRGSSSLPRKRLSSACSFWVPVLQGKPRNPWLWWRMSLVLASSLFTLCCISCWCIVQLTSCHHVLSNFVLEKAPIAIVLVLEPRLCQSTRRTLLCCIF